MGGQGFLSAFVDSVPNDERVVGDVLDDLFLFFPVFFEFFGVVVRLFVHDSFEQLRVLDLNVAELFFSVDLIEAFVHALSFVVDGVVSFEFLWFESGFFTHDGVDLFK